MSETESTNRQPAGSGAGPSLAAHSKDASVHGATPAAEATGSGATHPGADAATGSDTVSRLSGQAREAASHAAGSVAKAWHQARDRVVPEDASEQAMAFVRERPVTALLGAGVVGVAIGILLGRR
jgi:ElaB/YqjD/DUF883 family membrane-anchored ribosome-binding protein